MTVAELFITAGVLAVAVVAVIGFLTIGEANSRFGVGGLALLGGNCGGLSAPAG